MSTIAWRSSSACSAGSVTGSPEGRHHLVGEDTQRALHALQRQQAAGIQLGHEAGQAQLLTQGAEPLDEGGRGTDRDARFENGLVGELGELLELRLAPVRGAGVGAPHARARELGVALEKVGEVLVRLLDGFLLRWRRVDRHAQADVAVTGMARLSPGRAIVRDPQPQLRDVEIPEPDEQRQAQTSDDREGLLRVGRHPERRVREAVGAPAPPHVVETATGAVVAEPLALPGLKDDLQAFLEPRLAFAVGYPEHVVRPRRSAAPDAEVEAPLADLVD